MLRTFPCAPPADESRRAIALAGRCRQPPAASFSPFTALRMMCAAWRESLAASRQYEQLRSRGMPHDAALREALGMGLSPVRERRETPKALCFAGKA